ncbi:hypothetical protein LTR35_005355 [Friedmanniomyces endolithicus]|uniref:Uncharacterized protein n=1 Tax=Friedmanniomyces endolithicus TaxID=329885 RepID=A0AAN6JE90_9PEZI|nr:hypothetical protein LTR35_005355 [Friedmanniomyces endolithicus]KAK0326938.1 hypothetical protein LTR82_001698 [Friedmanniomyces endolithicus]
MSIIFKRPRFRKNPDPDASKGRLAVGWRIQDWTLVFYEPITTADDDANPNKFDKFDNEGAAELGLFRFDNPTGPPAYREPMKGEVAWLPHFDPARFTSRIGRERDLMQRRFLNDAHAYCLETDPEKEAALVARLTDDKHRMWASWFEEAQKWKKAGVKKRAVRRNGGGGEGDGEAPGAVPGPGNPGPDPKGGSNPDLDSDDEGYDDDGEEGAVRRSMPPPAIPKRKRGSGGTNGVGAAGKKSRRSTTGDGTGTFVSGPSPSPTPNEMMGGGLGGRDSNGAGTAYGGSLGGYDSDHDQPWDSNHSTPRPSPTPDPAPRSGPRGPNGLGGGGGASFALPTPNSILAQRQPNPPYTPNGMQNGGLNGTPSAPPRPQGRPNGPFVPGSPQPEDEAGANNDDGEAAMAVYNGEGVDEDEATRRAMRASLAPVDESQHPDIRRAMRASMGPAVNDGGQVNGGGQAHGNGGPASGSGQAKDSGHTNGSNGSDQANGNGHTNGGLPNGVQRSIEGGEDDDETYGGA